MRLAVIIINYCTPDLVLDCLHSLVGQINSAKDQVVVVDNNSNDDSVDRIEKAIRENNWKNLVRLIRSPVNGGFAEGNNVGIRSIHADYYMLLNSDTIVRNGAVNELLCALSSRKDVGIVSPRLEWLDGTAQESCFRNRSPLCEFFNAAKTEIFEKIFGYQPRSMPITDSPIEPVWISFACVIIRNEVFEKIGLLDSGYFMYFDDIDFCRRTSKSGYRILHWPKAHIVHLRGRSGPVKGLLAKRKRPPRYLYESRARYYRKFYGLPGVLAANIFWTVGRVISLTRELVGYKEAHISQREWLDVWINCLTPIQSSVAKHRRSQN